MKKRSKQTKDYRTYFFTWRDWVEYMLRITIKGVVICYLFYDSGKAFFLLAPFAVFDYRMLRVKKLEEQKRNLTQQFKSMIESLINSLGAGYSLEGAFEAAKRDLTLVYDRDAIIFDELDRILAGLRMNVPLEKLLQDFGERSGIDDIQDFSNVVAAAKRSGGNLIRIIQKTVNCITDKLAVEEEIETLITAKKLEKSIMMVMPYGIIFYLRLGNGAFFDVLYHNTLGVLLMTFFLILIYAADLWASRIMEISV